MEPGPLSLPHELDDASVFARVHHVEEPVVVESRFDGWERPWRALAPADWDELAREFGERVRLETLDTGRNRAFAARHRVEILPQVLVFLRGEVVARFQGRVVVTELVQAVRDVLRRDRAIEQAIVETRRAHRHAVTVDEREPARPVHEASAATSRRAASAALCSLRVLDDMQRGRLRSSRSQSAAPAAIRDVSLEAS